MKLSPKKREQPNYPGAKSSFVPNRELLGILASLGIAVGAATAGPAKLAGTPKPPKSKAEAEVKIPLGKMGAIIDALCAKLGDKDYKVRSKSSLKLIQIGKGQFSTAKEKDATKKLVLAAVAKLAKHKDPEVRNRAAKVKTALEIKRVIRQPIGNPAGGMRAPRPIIKGKIRAN